MLKNSKLVLATLSLVCVNDVCANENFALQKEPKPTICFKDGFSGEYSSPQKQPEPTICFKDGFSGEYSSPQKEPEPTICFKHGFIDMDLQNALDDSERTYKEETEARKLASQEELDLQTAISNSLKSLNQDAATY